MAAKRKSLAFILWLFTGLLGGHRFYMRSHSVGTMYVILMFSVGGLADTSYDDLSDTLAGIVALLWLFDLYWVLSNKSDTGSEIKTETTPPKNTTQSSEPAESGETSSGAVTTSSSDTNGLLASLDELRRDDGANNAQTTLGDERETDADREESGASEPPSSESTSGYEYPEDGITDTLDGLNSQVWERGYYCETDEGIWYEVYVNDEIKGHFPDINPASEDWEHLANFHCMNCDHYADDNQITFFVPDGEEEYTLYELTETLI